MGCLSTAVEVKAHRLRLPGLAAHTGLARLHDEPSVSSCKVMDLDVPLVQAPMACR
jgi:hypothetical protein